MEWFALCGNPYPPERDRGLVDYQKTKSGVVFVFAAFHLHRFLRATILSKTLMINQTQTGGCWPQPHRFPPRPIPMGAPDNALRAFDPGVSLKAPKVVAHKLPVCFRDHFFPLTFSRSWRASPWLALVQKSCLPYSALLALFFVNVPNQVILAHINPGTYFPGFI